VTVISTAFRWLWVDVTSTWSMDVMLQTHVSRIFSVLFSLTSTIHTFLSCRAASPRSSTWSRLRYWYTEGNLICVIFSLHQMHEMQTVEWCLPVCPSVRHIAKPYKNGWTDQHFDWGEHSWLPKEHCVTCRREFGDLPQRGARGVAGEIFLIVDPLHISRISAAGDLEFCVFVEPGTYILLCRDCRLTNFFVCILPPVAVKQTKQRVTSYVLA